MNAQTKPQWPIVRSEFQHSINGIDGLMCGATVGGNNYKPGTFTSQKFIASRPAGKDSHYGPTTLRVELRFDDECRNGHNTFAITAELRADRLKRDRGWLSGGCLHDEIARVFPELAHMIPRHLVSTDGPMHYESNVVYHAGDRCCMGKRKGEPTAFDTVMQFGAFPLRVKYSTRFMSWLDASVKHWQSTPLSNPQRPGYAVVPVEHPDNATSTGYKFAPKYTFSGYPCRWHECPFDTQREADDFVEAMTLFPIQIVSVPSSWSEGKARDLDAARNAAVWPEATDAELSVEPDELRAALRARLPALLARFRADIEACGFLWAPPAQEGAP